MAVLRQTVVPLLQRCQRLLVRAGMFDNLSQRLDKAWDLVRKDGKLTSDNIKEPMREIRRALLEADVRPPSSSLLLRPQPHQLSSMLSANVSPVKEVGTLSNARIMYDTACHPAFNGSSLHRQPEHPCCVRDLQIVRDPLLGHPG